MAIVCQCDRCKAIIGETETEKIDRIQVDFLSIYDNKGVYIGRSENDMEFHLCKACMNQFKTWMNAPLHN